MIEEAQPDPIRTRLMLLMCTLPQALGVYFAVMIPTLVGEVMAAGYLPEGTELPRITWAVLNFSAVSVVGERR